MYLAVVIGLYSHMVVGWAMRERMTATLIVDTPSVRCLMATKEALRRDRTL